MVNYGKTVWLTVVYHMVEPYPKHGSTAVKPWFNHGTFLVGKLVVYLRNTQCPLRPACDLVSRPFSQ